MWFLIDLLIAMLIVSGALYAIGWAIAKVMEKKMSDLISREQALNAIEWDTEAYTAINMLPSVDAKPQWIPCEERLPDIKEHHVSDACIVCCKNDAYGFAVLEENIFGQVGWDCERDDEYHTPLGKVVAWMPLPKPYERKEE